MVEAGQVRKIIHIDMDCFYAQVEMRDDITLANQPVAVGGHEIGRGVICTCNYIARKYGVSSAMPAAYALKLCPELIILPVNMEKYRKISQKIRKIFFQYTDAVEPLSLDEAYLDVSLCNQYQNSATWIAEEIRQQIYREHGLTASAGIAPNKFLAKIASDWQKPNGQYVIMPKQVESFVVDLPVKKIFGVGPVTEKKLSILGVRFCGELQKFTLKTLIDEFGSFGVRLYELSRGIDHRQVQPNRERKSLSVETTFSCDVDSIEACIRYLDELVDKLQQRMTRYTSESIRKLYIKIKFYDFTMTTVECLSNKVDKKLFVDIFQQGYARYQKPIRLLGVGVRFDEKHLEEQYRLFP